MNAPYSFTRIALWTVVLCPLMVVGCKDDDTSPGEDTNNRLEGEWNVISFTQDGVELVGAAANFQSVTYEFEKESALGGEVESTFLLNSGQTSLDEEDYELNEDGDELSLDDGEQYDIDVDDDDLELEGNIGGFAVRIRAERH